MEYRDFGKTGLKVSEVGMGCGWPTYRGEVNMVEFARQAFDLGVNFFDTADMYWSGKSEEILGEAFEGRRDQVVIATKYGMVVNNDVWGKEFGKAHMLEAVEGSLKRLRTDYIDIYQLHSPEPAILEDEELLAALHKLKQDGKIRFFGISLDGAEFIKQAIEKWEVDSIQVTFNLFNLDVARAFDKVREAKVGLIAKSPLDSGMLSGELMPGDAPIVNDPRARWGEEKTRQRQEYMEQLRGILEKPGRSWPQAALQFLFSFDVLSTAIVGTTSIAHLKENIKASGKRLAPEELEKIRQLAGGEFAKLNLGW